MSPRLLALLTRPQQRDQDRTLSMAAYWSLYQRFIPRQGV